MDIIMIRNPAFQGLIWGTLPASLLGVAGTELPGFQPGALNPTVIRIDEAGKGLRRFLESSGDLFGAKRTEPLAILGDVMNGAWDMKSLIVRHGQLVFLDAPPPEKNTVKKGRKAALPAWKLDYLEIGGLKVPTEPVEGVTIDDLIGLEFMRMRRKRGWSRDDVERKLKALPPIKKKVKKMWSGVFNNEEYEIVQYHYRSGFNTYKHYENGNKVVGDDIKRLVTVFGYHWMELRGDLELCGYKSCKNYSPPSRKLVGQEVRRLRLLRGWSIYRLRNMIREEYEKRDEFWGNVHLSKIESGWFDRRELETIFGLESGHFDRMEAEYKKMAEDDDVNLNEIYVKARIGESG